jgi:hypothetical protein
MHSFAVALLLSSAAAFAPKAASRPSVAVAAMPSQDELKKQVGYQAIDDYVTSGMKVGLGTGSTAAFAVERLGMLLKDGTLKDIIAVPTSVRTKEQAEELGIPLTTLDEFSRLDVAIDGADLCGFLFKAPHAIDATSSPFLCLIDGVTVTLDNFAHWSICTQAPTRSTPT